MNKPVKYRFNSERSLIKFVTDSENGQENTDLAEKALGTQSIAGYSNPFYLIDAGQFYSRFELCDKFGNIVPMSSRYSYFSEGDVKNYLEKVVETKESDDTEEDQLGTIDISEQSCDICIEGRFTKSQVKNIIAKLQEAIR